MLDLSKLFWESNAKPVQYKGKTIMMGDDFPIPKNELIKLKYVIISTDSEWRQGIAIKTKGLIESSDGNKITRGWGDIWEDRAPHEDYFYCKSKDGFLEVKNIWDTGNGCIESWNNGAAMWYEEIPNGRRYHCNDGHFDDDFNDIIFEIQIVG